VSVRCSRERCYGYCFTFLKIWNVGLLNNYYPLSHDVRQEKPATYAREYVRVCVCVSELFLMWIFDSLCVYVCIHASICSVSVFLKSVYSCKFWVFHGADYENAVYWDVTPCGCCNNRRFGEMCRLYNLGDKKRRARNNVSKFLRSMIRLRVTLNVVLARWFLSPWWWRRYVSPKSRFLQELHCVIS
jgi:hypothetical protein